MLFFFVGMIGLLNPNSSFFHSCVAIFSIVYLPSSLDCWSGSTFGFLLNRVLGEVWSSLSEELRKNTVHLYRRIRNFLSCPM